MQQGKCPKTGNAHTLPAADSLGGGERPQAANTRPGNPASSTPAHLLLQSSCPAPGKPPARGLPLCPAPPTPNHPPFTARQMSCAKRQPDHGTSCLKPPLASQNPEYFTTTPEALYDLRPALHPNLTLHLNRLAPCTRRACSYLRAFALAAPTLLLGVLSQISTWLTLSYHLCLDPSVRSGEASPHDQSTVRSSLAPDLDLFSPQCSSPPMSSPLCHG